MAIEIEVGKRSFVIPQTDDPCDLWRSYFLKLKKETGYENAKMLWLITWSKNGSASCTTNSEFNQFLRKNQIDVSNASTRAVADISAIGSNVLGMGKNLTRMFSIGLPITLGVLLVAILIILFNTAKDADAGDLALLHPAGRMAQVKGTLKS